MNNILFRNKTDVNLRNIKLLNRGKNLDLKQLETYLIDMFNDYKQFSVRCSDGEILAYIDLNNNLWVKDNKKIRNK